MDPECGSHLSERWCLSSGSVTCFYSISASGHLLQVALGCRLFSRGCAGEAEGSSQSNIYLSVAIQKFFCCFSK